MEALLRIKEELQLQVAAGSDSYGFELWLREEVGANELWLAVVLRIEEIQKNMQRRRLATRRNSSAFMRSRQ